MGEDGRGRREARHPRVAFVRTRRQSLEKVGCQLSIKMKQQYQGGPA